MAKASNNQPSCKLNKLLICGIRHECKKCGWYPPEIKRRKALLKSNGLKKSKSGNRFLSLKNGDSE